jgi:hypothetical protein
MVVPRFAGWDGTARGFFTLAGAAILCARLLSACRAGRLLPPPAAVLMDVRFTAPLTAVSLRRGHGQG